MPAVYGRDQVLEELEVDGELVLAGRELRVEHASAGHAALHIDDAKARAADKPIEKRFPVRLVTPESR